MRLCVCVCVCREREGEQTRELGVKQLYLERKKETKNKWMNDGQFLCVMVYAPKGIHRKEMKR